MIRSIMKNSISTRPTFSHCAWAMRWRSASSHSGKASLRLRSAVRCQPVSGPSRLKSQAPNARGRVNR